MLVICRKFIHYATGEEMDSSFWLTSRGKEYTVFSVILGPRYGLSLCIQGDDRAGITYPGIEGFEFVEQNIPSTWIVTIRELANRKVMMMLPRSWNYTNFEEDLSQGESKSSTLFAKEVELIYKELGYDKAEWTEWRWPNQK